MTSSAISRTHGQNLLGIYLNDHLAGATAGVELARRVAGTRLGLPGESVLPQLATEIAADRDALQVPVRGYKVRAGWIAEKAGRLKLNGYLLGRSPLSNLEELEMMRLGVEGKAAGWRTLRTLAEADERLDPGELDELISRAGRQADLLEDLRVRAAGKITGTD